MKTIAYSILILLFAGCAGIHNAEVIKTDILFEEHQLQDLNKKIDSLDNQRITKVAAGKLDETTDSVTKVYIQRLKDTVNFRLNYFKAIVSNNKSRKEQRETLTYLANAKQQYNMELNNIFFLDDLFKASTFNRLNTAAFFGSGEYQLNDSASKQASLIMQKIIDEAMNFSSRHADRKLKAMFIVLGYADEQDITIGSPLYKELVMSAGAGIPDRRHLNTELSNRRASSIKNLIKEEYRVKFSNKEGYLFSSSFVATGKGEMIPPGNFKNYAPVDERRRVVLLYWSILPDLE